MLYAIKKEKCWNEVIRGNSQETVSYTHLLSDGRIVVDADDADKVQLVLDGVDIVSADSAAVYVLSADKVFITTASGSENTLANGGEYAAIDDNNCLLYTSWEGSGAGESGRLRSDTDLDHRAAGSAVRAF